MIGVILVLVAVGVSLYLLLTYVPMAAPVKTVITAVVVIALIVWLLSFFGLLDWGGPGAHRAWGWRGCP